MQSCHSCHATTDYEEPSPEDRWYRSKQRTCPLCKREGKLTIITDRAICCKPHCKTPTGVKLVKQVNTLLDLADVVMEGEE